MRTDGLKPSLLALNSLINAFGEDQRDNEAFAVLQYMKENVSYYLKFFTLVFFPTVKYNYSFHRFNAYTFGDPCNRRT